MKNKNDPPAFLITTEVALTSISATRRLEEKLDAIEGLLKSGISRQAVVELLNKNRFKFTISSFASVLKRVRKKSNLPIDPSNENNMVAGLMAMANVAQPKTKEPRKFIYDIHSPVEWKRAKP
ncbi:MULTISPECIES: hypothetical protein [unclassified Duganella]|uniref:hypothetical protein n=1 Tax=unclassified Duganella TaxID=2636909 RepID=UPI0011C0EA46|nr:MULTISPECIES: hypothetical protein [unclassified Duganella]